MANAGTVTVDFAAEVAKFNAQMKQVNDRVKSVESSFKQMSGVVDSALKLFSIGIATNFIRSAAEAADQLGKTADKLGISTERLTAFQLAAADAGVETSTLTKLLVDAQRRLGDAAGGTGATFEAIQSLGLSVRELQRLSPDQLFLRYAEALETVTARSEKFALAQDLFGKTAQEGFALIASGSEAIDVAAATVDRLGLALTRVDIAKIEVANDKLGLLAKTSQAFGQQTAAALSPFVTEFVDRLTSVGTGADDARTKLETFATAVFVAFEVMANGARVFDLAVSGAFLAFAKANELAFAALRSGLELTAELDEAVGLDSLAAKFRGFVQSAGEAESFAAALSENALARVKAAAEGIKGFEQIFAEADQIRRRAQQQAEAAAAEAAAAAAGLTGESRLESIQFELNSELELRDEFFNLRLAQEYEFIQEINKIREELDLQVFANEERNRYALVKQTEQQILSVKQGAANAAVGLLQVLAGRNKAAALALIAFEKIRAIAQAKINTAVAVTNALAYVPYPANLAAAAQVATLGAVQIGLIVATGVAEAANVLSSSGPGASLGSPQNPVFTDTRSGADGGASARAGATQRPVQVVNVYGWSEQAIRELYRVMRETGSDYDLQIVRQD